MKKLLYITVLCVCSFFVAQSTHAATIKLTKYVTDTANVIPDDVETSLEGVLRDFEMETSNQFVIVTIPNLPQGDTIETAAYSIFNNNNLGQKDKNNGLLFLLSTAERKTRFEVGYGLEPVFPDILAGRVLSEDIAPAFKAGDYGSGMTIAANKVMEILRKGDVYQKTAQDTESTATGDINLISTILFIVIFIFRILFHFFAKSKSILAGIVLGTIVGLIGFLITGTVLMFGFIVLGGLLDWMASTAIGKKLQGWSMPRGVHWGGGGGWSSGRGGGFSGGGGSSGGGGASGGY